MRSSLQEIVLVKHANFYFRIPFTLTWVSGPVKNLLVTFSQLTTQDGRIIDITMLTSFHIDPLILSKHCDSSGQNPYFVFSVGIVMTKTLIAANIYWVFIFCMTLTCTNFLVIIMLSSILSPFLKGKRKYREVRLTFNSCKW